MRVEFTSRAARDLRAIGANSRRQFGERVAAALEARLHEVIDQITHAPQSAPRLEQRPDTRVVLLGRYPFKIYYRIIGDAVRIVRVRHTARRPWSGT